MYALKSYQRHVRKDHPLREKIDAQDFQERNKIICLMPRKSNPSKLCEKQISKDVIVRHLKDMHSVERDDKKLIFKGFVTGIYVVVDTVPAIFGSEGVNECTWGSCDI